MSKRKEEKERARQYLKEHPETIMKTIKILDASVRFIRRYSFKTRFKIAMTIIFKPLKRRKRKAQVEEPAKT